MRGERSLAWRVLFASPSPSAVTGIACTDAILSAVKEEAAVVQLAQQLVAHEVVVAETTR